jgi:hypothetical protein
MFSPSALAGVVMAKGEKTFQINLCTRSDHDSTKRKGKKKLRLIVAFRSVFQTRALLIPKDLI